MVVVVPASASEDNLELRSSPEGISRDGHIRLAWEGERAPGEAEYEVQQADNEHFNNARAIYQGPDLATFVSGLENGTYYYRIRSGEGEWSDTLLVEVRHPSLRLTFLLLGIGAVVFLLTAGIVIKGARQPT